MKSNNYIRFIYLSFLRVLLSKTKYTTKNMNTINQQNCIMRYKDFDYLRVKKVPIKEAISINIVFITQLLSSKMDKLYDKFYDKMITLGGHNHRILLLDYELNKYHHNHNMSVNHHIDDRYDHNPEYGRDLLRNNSYYQVYEQWISPWHLTSSSAIPVAKLNNEGKIKPYLFSNIDILQTTETFLFNDILIGLIIYNIHHNGVILYDLKQWIHFQAKCLRKSGTDIIILIGNGDYQFNEEILATSSHIINLFLVISHHNDNNSDKNSVNDTSNKAFVNANVSSSSHRIIQLSNNLGVTHEGENRIAKYYAHINLNYHESYFNISSMILEII